MNPMDPLAQLQPLREPPPVGWWPPAPGWWLLLAVLLALLCAGAWWLWRRHRANAYRREALRQLRRVEQRYGGRGDGARMASELNALLKVVALQSFPPAQVAGISGEPWVRLLEDTLPPERSIDPVLGEALYRAEPPAIDEARLLADAAFWIRRHRRPA